MQHAVIGADIDHLLTPLTNGGRSLALVMCCAEGCVGLVAVSSARGLNRGGIFDLVRQISQIAGCAYDHRTGVDDVADDSAALTEVCFGAAFVTARALDVGESFRSTGVGGVGQFFWILVEHGLLSFSQVVPGEVLKARTSVSGRLYFHIA